MNKLQEIESLFNLVDAFNKVLPEKTDESLEINGLKINLNKNGNEIKISIISNEELDEEFDDTKIKEIIKEHKDNIKELDDNLFIEIVKDIRSVLDIKKFDELLNKESFNEDEASEVGNMINLSSQIICKHLQNKINELVNIYNKF